MEVNLIHITPNTEQLIADIARVSTGKKDSPYGGLFEYLIKHNHWSPFEMASMCVEIYTSRAIGRQILRHRSFSFQEFSQRYSSSLEVENYKPRREHDKNRQSSVDDLDDETIAMFNDMRYELEEKAFAFYNTALSFGVARESARFLLPESTSTRMYMAGTIRSWIHYLLLRTQDDVQLEHREVANAIADIFKKELPVLGEVLT